MLGPDEQLAWLTEKGYTHVECDTYWDRGTYTVEEYTARMRALE